MAKDKDRSKGDPQAKGEPSETKAKTPKKPRGIKSPPLAERRETSPGTITAIIDGQVQEATADQVVDKLNELVARGADAAATIDEAGAILAETERTVAELAQVSPDAAIHLAGTQALVAATCAMAEAGQGAATPAPEGDQVATPAGPERTAEELEGDAKPFPAAEVAQIGLAAALRDLPPDERDVFLAEVEEIAEGIERLEAEHVELKEAAAEAKKCVEAEVLRLRAKIKSRKTAKRDAEEAERRAEQRKREEEAEGRRKAPLFEANPALGQPALFEPGSSDDDWRVVPIKALGLTPKVESLLGANELRTAGALAAFYHGGGELGNIKGFTHARCQAVNKALGDYWDRRQQEGKSTPDSDPWTAENAAAHAESNPPAPAEGEAIPAELLEPTAAAPAEGAEVLEGGGGAVEGAEVLEPTPDLPPILATDGDLADEGSIGDDAAPQFGPDSPGGERWEA